ncbi:MULTISPECIES: TAXI family TRAP transporter solute-binding subunit [Rhodomicrobium]|uniref:TAXI family TRAP transporter solute-binding subunit n=1 Tax=Rhodomicrobium TaxID=1068 RepID=UPI00148241E1|nr:MULTISPECIES: TAXI family TRAP transporter solute-binding subunit [Rhodomicrobium]
MSSSSAAQQRAGTEPVPTNPYAAASNWTLGMMTGELDGTSLRMANEIAVALNDGPNLRVVPMIGESSIRNVTDLFYLPGVDVAIVQSDVLSNLRRTKRMPGIEDRLNYLAKLHSEEFHVLSRMKYLCLAELTGRKVNFGPAGSGSALTAEAVFEASKVQVQPQYLDYPTAADKLRRGEIDATVFVSGKPAQAFERMHHQDGVHFLDVDFADELQRDYLPAIMTHDDYPDLIAPNETVSTIAVSAVMAVFNSPPRSDRYRKLERFADSFFSKFEQFRQPPHHVKWREVTLSTPVPGWTRFPAAQQWLKDHPESAAARSGTALSLGLEPGGSEAARLQLMFERYTRDRGPVSGDDREKLFKDFMRWYQQGNLN